MCILLNFPICLNSKLWPFDDLVPCSCCAPNTNQTTVLICNWKTSNAPGSHFRPLSQNELMLHPEMTHWRGIEPVPLSGRPINKIRGSLKSAAGCCNLLYSSRCGPQTPFTYGSRVRIAPRGHVNLRPHSHLLPWLQNFQWFSFISILFPLYLTWS